MLKNISDIFAYSFISGCIHFNEVHYVHFSFSLLELKCDQQIENSKQFIAENNFEAYDQLPASLDEACNCLRGNTVLRKRLGTDMVSGFTVMKEKEAMEYKKEVTQLEIKYVDDY